MKKIVAFTGLACILLMSSCSRDGLDGGKNSSTLSVTVSLDKMASESATRASVAPETGEDKVNTLYLYFFDASDSRSGMFVDYIQVEGSLAMDSKYTLQTAGTSISVSNAYNIIAIANIDDGRYISGDMDTWNSQWSGRTEEYFRANAFAGISGTASESDNSKAIEREWIPMSGATTKEAMSGDIRMTLVRNVARFDVINSIDTSYGLESASIWNAYSRSSLTGDGVLDYSKTLGLRTERFYGVNNTGVVLGNIMGGLYAFENKVTSPSPGDQHTTCLIIGLRNKTNDKIGYYRVNIHPNESAQNLKRNNVYRVTVTGVKGDGAASESDAYAGTKNELEYAINYWDLDDNGLIVSDQYSILAVPVKTVRIGAEGGDFSYTITTFSSLASPSPLAVKSQTYDPSNGKISAALTGATLTIHAQSLAPGEGNRTGIITVSYAGLEAYVNVVQSESVDTYLNVTLEDTWVSKLGSTAGLSSEYIYVNASGTWTAELFGDGFSFSSNTGVAAQTTLSSASATNNKFHVYTHTQNNTGAERKAFVLISLDSDPVNYISVVPIYQKVVGAINISPDAETITFNGSKAIISHPSNTFTVSSAGGSISGFTLSGPDAGKFTVTLPTGDPSAVMTVTANELNTSGNNYLATLRIADDTGAEKFVTLRQNSLLLSVSPGTFSTPIVAAGGQTDLITVSTGDASSQFTATINTASSTSGKTLYNHAAYFVNESGNPIDLSLPQSVNTKFKVAFPKVYFPNREMGITATITVNIAGSSLTRTITVDQAALTSKGTSTWNVITNGYGGLEVSYVRGYANALKALGCIWSNPNDRNGTQAIPAATTYVHVTNNDMNSSFNWTNIESFRTGKDGIVFFIADDYGNLTPVNSATSPLNKCGYTVTASNRSGGGNNVPLHSNLRNTRVGLFLTTYGATAIEASSISPFYTDGTQTALTAYPATAVPIMYRTNDNNMMMTIDPVNRLVYLGEGQVFQENQGSGNRSTFWTNFTYYVLNSAKYGSHFTDMLRDDLAGSIPAMWDDAWGANKWPDNK